MTQLTCGLLASGGLGMTALQTVQQHASLSFVMTDRGSKQICEFCEESEIPAFVGNPRGGRSQSFLSGRSVDVILSINYLFIVEADVLQLPRLMAVNLHGSLLPGYRGRTPHVWAIINNETETGVTAHVMEEGCDTGDVLLQRTIAISHTVTGAGLLETFHLLYPEMIRELLQQLEAGTWTRIRQDESRATYFHRRTPDDGQICWHWQRERIYNWIRAQARPYPGAFFLREGDRYHVHASRLSDLGFDSAVPNGTVLCADPLTIKTPNGAIELIDHEFPSATIQPGAILD